MATILDFRMQAALIACSRTPDREFREIAAAFGVDREALQERFFDLKFPARCPNPQSLENLRHDAHLHLA